MNGDRGIPGAWAVGRDPEAYRRAVAPPESEPEPGSTRRAQREKVTFLLFCLVPALMGGGCERRDVGAQLPSYGGKLQIARGRFFKRFPFGADYVRNVKRVSDSDWRD